MSKKQELFTITPTPRPSGVGTSLASAFQPSHLEAAAALRPLTRTEKRMVAEYSKQLLANRLQEQKTEFAQQHIAALHVHALATFAQAAEEIWAMSEQPRHPGVQAYVDTFRDRSIRRCGAFIEEATDIGSSNILTVTQTSLYLRPERVRPGFIARLFGRTREEDDEY
jgi:hypothetical protein